MFTQAEILRRRSALERLYDGLCTITHQTEVVDDDGISSFEDVVIAENVPCRVSIGSSPYASQGNDIATVNQTITLFLPPEIEIKQGAKIEVTQYGVVAHYKCAGVPAVYDVFQSVEMELMENGC
jgi:hypothetical protein